MRIIKRIEEMLRKSHQWMIATMTLVGVLASSFSLRISDTTLSVDWITDAYSAEITGKVIAILDSDTIEVLHNLNVASV